MKMMLRRNISILAIMRNFTMKRLTNRFKIKGKKKNDSEYLYINDLWIHPQYRKGKIINLFIRLLEKDHRTKNVKYIYWSREKYDGRLSKLLTRNRAVKKGVDYAYAII